MANHLVAPLRLADGPAPLVSYHFSVRGQPPLRDVRGCSLFHDPKFFALHVAPGVRRGLYLTVTDACGDPVGVGHALQVDGSEWESPGRGTFGGVQWLRPHPDGAALCDAYLRLEDEVRNAGGTSLRVTLPPSAHDESHARASEEALRQLGYTLLWTDQNFSVPVTQQGLRELMNRGKRQMVDRARKSGMTPRRLVRDEFAAAHALIADCRERRGRPMTMTLEALTAMHEQLPGAMVWMGLFSGETLVGAMILMRVREQVLYIPFVGNHESGEYRGSKELLLDIAYAEAQAGGYRLMDYGIATEQGVANDGLIAFKTRIGLSSHPRTTWSKRWSAS